MFKKISAILLALTMIISMSFVVNAETTYTVTASPKGGLIEGRIFEIDFVITGATQCGSAQFTITYNPAAAVPVVDANGTAAGAGPVADASYLYVVGTGLTAMGANHTVGGTTNTLALIAGDPMGNLKTLTEGLVMTARFKALDEDADLGLSFVCDTFLADGKVDITANVEEVANAADFDIVGQHTAPSISGVTVTPAEAVVGTELTAATVDFSDNWGLADASTFAWVIDGKTVSTSNKYTPAIADINKTITVTATPAVSEELAEAPFTGEAKSTTVKVIIPATYVPTVSIEIGEEGAVLAALPVVPVVTYEETYKEVTEYDVEYTYYVVPAELVAEAEGDKLEAAIAAVEAATEGVVTLEDDTYAPEYKDDYAVVKAEATYTIAGEAHATKPVDYAAALIKGEPPVLAEGADAVIEKLAAKKFFTSSTPDVTDVEFESKVVEGAVEENYDKIDYSYAWYLTSELKTADTFVADEATAITAEAALATPGKVKLSKVEATEGKYLVAVITATDALTISSSTTVFFTNPIKKATGGSGTQGGASLVTGTQGGTVVEPDEPAVEPEKDPADPAGEANDKGATVFTDVDKEAYAWAYEGIDALTKAGVIKGMTETTFGPELTATNAQMIALAVRIAGLTAEGATTDKVDAEHWVAAELAVADAKGILGVYGDKIDVEGATSREIAFTLLYNALKAAGVELAETAEAIEFTDAASIDANCVEAINALVKAGIVNGMGDGTLAPKATLTRAQLAKILGMANALVTK